MATTQDAKAQAAPNGSAKKLLEDAGAFFQGHLWESNYRDVQVALTKKQLGEEVLRAFGVGYAPVGPSRLLDHLRELGYDDEEIVAAGLAHRSVRGHLHAYFRSRVMFPVKDRDGRILGFAGLATHLGPSWSLWMTSPDNGLYSRSSAVYGLDLAGDAISDSGVALVQRDSVEVLRDHQDGKENAVTVHSHRLTRAQIAALGDQVKGGVDALELDVPTEMPVDDLDEPEESAEPRRGPVVERKPAPPVPYLHVKKVAIVIATALAAINVWTLAPLIAVWAGSRAQAGQVVSLWGVVTVLAVMSVLAFLCAWALTWLHAKYDELTGRPPLVGQTSPWGRRMRGELNEHFRTVYGLSAPERAVAACVLAAFLAMEIWFFFFAGSSIG